MSVSVDLTSSLLRPSPTHRKDSDVIVPGCQWMCESVFEKQIDVCLHEGVFPFNNKLTETCSHGICQSDLPVANHHHGAVWRGVMCHIGQSGDFWEWREGEE